MYEKFHGLSGSYPALYLFIPGDQFGERIELAPDWAAHLKHPAGRGRVHSTVHSIVNLSMPGFPCFLSYLMINIFYDLMCGSRKKIEGNDCFNKC